MTTMQETILTSKAREVREQIEELNSKLKEIDNEDVVTVIAIGAYIAKDSDGDFKSYLAFNIYRDTGYSVPKRVSEELIEIGELISYSLKAKAVNYSVDFSSPQSIGDAISRFRDFANSEHGKRAILDAIKRRTKEVKASYYNLIKVLEDELSQIKERSVTQQ